MTHKLAADICAPIVNTVSRKKEAEKASHNLPGSLVKVELIDQSQKHPVSTGTRKQNGLRGRVCIG